MGRSGGRAPCCDKAGLRKGAWTAAEDERLAAFILQHGHRNWRALPREAGLLRCGKSCRLRWINYLRPGVKRGNFTGEEEETIIRLHGLMGNRWSKIASYLPGRTDNEIKNVWNTHLKKRLCSPPKESTPPLHSKSGHGVESPAGSTVSRGDDSGEHKGDGSVSYSSFEATGGISGVPTQENDCRASPSAGDYSEQESQELFMELWNAMDDDVSWLPTQEVDQLVGDDSIETITLGEDSTKGSESKEYEYWLDYLAREELDLWGGMDGNYLMP